MKTKSIINFLILILLLICYPCFAQELDFNISIISMYRTCEMIEITGNEDQFDIILNINLTYSYNLSSNWLLLLSINLNLRLPYATKARFYEFFAPNLIETQNIGFYFINKNLSFNF